MASLFGDVDSTIHHMAGSASPMLNATLLVLLQVTFTVVLLNALIAIMSDTFDKMQDRKDEAQQINRCQLVVEFMRKELDEEQRKGLYGAFKWVHLMQPNKLGEGEGDDEWAGRIKVIRELVTNLDLKVSRISTKVDLAQADASSKMGQLGEVQQRQTHILAEIVTKLDQLASR
jgi:hypothetical protein